MTEQEKIINTMMERPISVLSNTVHLVTTLARRYGPDHAERVIREFCRENNLPRCNYRDFLTAIESAIQRKYMTVDPESFSPNIFGVN